MPGWQQRLYALAPWKVKEWLVDIEALRLNHFRRYGDYEAVRRAYAFSRYQDLSQDDLREWQLGRLRSLVAYAREHCAFYRGRLPEHIQSLDDLRLIPVLRKADVRDHAAIILAKGFPRHQLWPDHTSGTTGSPLHFFIGREGVRARFYFYGPFAPVQVRVWDANHNALSLPVTATPTQDGWLEVDLSAQNVIVTGDFYVGYLHLTDYTPTLGSDFSAPDGRSYEVDGQYWQQQTSKDYLIRATVRH